MKPFVVQKFGGTSVGTAERIANVAQIISESANQFKPVVVVSATSGTTKVEGTTSLLLEAIESAVEGGDFESVLVLIHRNHLGLIKASFRTTTDPSFEAEARNFLEEVCLEAQRTLSNVRKSRRCPPKDKDLVLAVGERLSAKILSVILNSRGTLAKFIDLSKIVKGNIAELTRPVLDLLRTELAATVLELTEIPVITGFFGPLQGGILHTVGRGYSDFTAALIASGLGQSAVAEMQVWKEVDGVFTADPRKVPNAKVLSQMSGKEAAEITFFGSEVIHHFTMEQVMNERIPLRVKNVLRPEGNGTLITPELMTRKQEPAAVTGKKGVTVFMISSHKMVNVSGFLASVFDVFRRHKIVIDLVSTSEAGVSCTINQLQHIEFALPELRTLGEITLTTNRAILSLVGDGVTKIIGAAGAMLNVVSEVTNEIDMITQASTNVNISCVIPEKHLEAALIAVHSLFFENSVSKIRVDQVPQRKQLLAT